MKAVLEKVAALDSRLAAIEGRLLRLEGDDILTTQAAPAELGDIEQRISHLEALKVETADDSLSSRVARKQSMLMPSRGWLGNMHYGVTNRKIEVHAFLDLEYIDAGSDGLRGGVSTFDNHHANLFVQSALRDNLLGHIELEFEHGGDSVEVDQAFLSWAVTDTLSLDIGRFYTPFGIERFVWYSPTNALISRPEPMRQIVPGNFYANGLVASGHIKASE